MFVHGSRVYETSTTNGIGPYSLAGAVAGYVSFGYGIGDGNTCYYVAEDGANWEEGVGTVDSSGSPDTLTRTEVKRSSNNNQAVDWAGGTTKRIFCVALGSTYPEVVAGVAAPVNPSLGMQWFDLVNNFAATRIFDGVNSVWAEIGSAFAPWQTPQGILDMADLWKFLTADDTGQNVNTAQPWFPTAGSVTVQASTTYRCMGFLHLIRSAGSTSHTTGIGFGGTATVTSMRGLAWCNASDVSTTSTPGQTTLTSASNTSVKAASTSTTEEINIFVLATVRINGGGTWTPQFTYSAAPGGAPTVKANSFWFMTPIGLSTAASAGTWA